MNRLQNRIRAAKIRHGIQYGGIFLKVVRLSLSIALIMSDFRLSAPDIYSYNEPESPSFSMEINMSELCEYNDYTRLYEIRSSFHTRRGIFLGVTVRSSILNIVIILASISPSRGISTTIRQSVLHYS